MTSKQDTARARIHNTKTDLKSPSTCSQATVSTLRSLLYDNLEDDRQKENLKSRSAQLGNAQTTTSRRGIAAKTTTSAAGDGRRPQLLPPRERYILATEIANTTLKSLADALKTDPAQRTPKRATAPHTQRPLQERDAGQVHNSPQKVLSHRRSSSCCSQATAGSGSGLWAVAECARIAFAYLRTPGAVHLARKDAPALQLENGMLALIGKLVAHGFDGLAVKELRILKKRLFHFIRQKDMAAPRAHTKADPGPKTMLVTDEKETLASLLDFGNVDLKSPAVPLITTHQTYVLRIIARTRRSHVVEEAWTYLKLSNPGSPANLLWQGAGSTNAEPKQLRQLESLAHTVLSMCPIVSSSPVHSSSPGIELSPETAFSLQLLAFKIRQRWWELAGHQGNEEKELLEPFLRCLMSFAKRSTLSPVKKYKLAEFGYTDLVGNRPESEISSSHSRACKVLSTLARSASLMDEAMRWLEPTELTPTSTESAARRIVGCVKRATLALSSPSKVGDDGCTAAMVEDTLSALSTSIDGSSAELEALFLEVNAFRRAASAMVLAGLRAGIEDLARPQKNNMNAIAASVRFATKYLRRQPESITNADVQARSEDRIGMVSKCLKSVLDSISVCSKLPFGAEVEEQWETFRAILQDGENLLRFVEESGRLGAQYVEGLQHPFVRLSNAYWTVHLQMTKAIGVCTSSLAAMKDSINVLLSRPSSEQRIGLLAMKQEKVGERLSSLGDDVRALGRFAASIGALTDSGVLQEATEAAASVPLRNIFEIAESTGVLGRVLKSYHRCALKVAPDPAIYDDVGSPTANRAILLEWQLVLYSKTLSRTHSWDAKLSNSVQDLAKRLLALYKLDQYPVRLRRTCALLLRMSHERPDALLLSSLASRREELNTHDDPTSTHDAGLAKYNDCLKALLELRFELQASSPDTTKLLQSFRHWESLIESTSSWDAVLEHVDDAEHWIEDMQGAADYLAAKGEEYSCIPVLHLLCRVRELQKRDDSSDLVTSHCTFANQLLELGYSGKSGLIFAKLEGWMKTEDMSTEAKLKWHIGYAQYLLHMGDLTQSESILMAANHIARADEQFMSLAHSSTTLSGRLRFNAILADACHVYSVLHLRRGSHQQAARYAKQSVLLTRRIWAALESKQSSQKMPQSSDSTEAANAGSTTFDPLSSMRDDKGAPLVTTMTHASLDGPELWTIVPRLHRFLMQQSQIFAHQGLLQEAVYAAEQAEKVALATASPSLTLENSSCRANYWALSGRPDKAQTAIESNETHKSWRYLSAVHYHSAVARICHSSGENDNELTAYTNMEKVLDELSCPTFVRRLDTFSPSVAELTERMSHMALEKAQPEKKQPSKAVKGRKPAAKSRPKATHIPERKAAMPAIAPRENMADECLPLENMRADTMRRKALLSLTQDDVSSALQLVRQAQNSTQLNEHAVSQLWVSFKATLAKCFDAVSSDFELNTLPESTIAFPAMIRSESTPSQPATSRGGAKIARKTTKAKKEAKKDLVHMLVEASDYLKESYNLYLLTSSNHGFRQTTLSLGQVTILLSALSQDDAQGSMQPLYAAYMSDISKCRSLTMARESTEIERENMSREEYMRWPSLESHAPHKMLAVSDFAQEYIDIIPETWTVLSLSLNEDQNELYITRYERASTPFALRLPMARHTFRDMDEEEFSFADGKRDFEEIIELSDFSTKTAKDMTSREARIQWWAEREALDTRLHELLQNMENIWLGGFKGIFSQHTHHPTLLARFRKSFDDVLNRHLPSRQGRGRQKQRTNFDSRILELFVGLGDATDTAIDLDEALTDLIYFVVDILQFNGERNAYDEIDFDAMAIDTLDALKTYHAAAASHPAQSTHTILVLDQDLHMFPWESLPCLQSLSISRLSSLAALKERLTAARLPTIADGLPPGHYIPASAGGTSILNPSGDLTHTSKTLEPRLNDLEGQWTHISNRAPSEVEFESALKSQDLVLYFGHGSGAQFIRSKTVRRLYPGITSESTKEKAKPGCATTCLFGCSSVHLTENGIYEPSGMLNSYMVAGAPAVVGMLWDVTDKDCDRFAVRMGDLWGLWHEEKGEGDDKGVKTPAAKKGSKGNGKGKGKVAQIVAEVEGARKTPGRRRVKDALKAAQDEAREDGSKQSRRRGVGLDEAVRDARDACVLRYLNGAAAVVYGIPVYLQ